MVHHCDLCSFETPSLERFAGHRSGHVRRGELAKRKRRELQPRTCPDCGLVFLDGRRLAGHRTCHRPQHAFELLKRDGSRKRFLIRERGHQCEECKITEWQGRPAPITLDHVDGNTDNNVKSNLKLLCPNCHAQTPTFCGKNMGRFDTAKSRYFAGRRHGVSEGTRTPNASF